tara:strand:- start:1 stop:240 length:240 start_codon:yes stop_codon:yes gene_type:complete
MNRIQLSVCIIYTLLCPALSLAATPITSPEKPIDLQKHAPGVVAATDWQAEIQNGTIHRHAYASGMMNEPRGLVDERTR